jgi:hypothetical protein
MNFALYPFMVLAACGFALSVAAHIAALAGIAIPGGGQVWVLHIGIFVVWLPTVLVGNRIARYANRKDFWKVALAGCPAWMRRGLFVLFGYAIVNFILFIVSTTSQPKPTGAAPPSVTRGFSGHWMVFYAAAFATLYSATHAPHLLRERKCPLGHAVSPSARFCPECGYAFPDEHQNI